MSNKTFKRQWQARTASFEAVSAEPDGPGQSFVAEGDDVYVVSDQVGRRLRHRKSRRRCRTEVLAAAIDALADPGWRLDVLFMSSPAFS